MLESELVALGEPHAHDGAAEAQHTYAAVADGERQPAERAAADTARHRPAAERDQEPLGARCELAAQGGAGYSRLEEERVQAVGGLLRLVVGGGVVGGVVAGR